MQSLQSRTLKAEGKICSLTVKKSTNFGVRAEVRPIKNTFYGLMNWDSSLGPHPKQFAPSVAHFMGRKSRACAQLKRPLKPPAATPRIPKSGRKKRQKTDQLFSRFLCGCESSVESGGLPGATWGHHLVGRRAAAASPARHSHAICHRAIASLRLELISPRHPSTRKTTNRGGGRAKNWSSRAEMSLKRVAPLFCRRTTSALVVRWSIMHAPWQGPPARTPILTKCNESGKSRCSKHIYFTLELTKCQFFKFNCPTWECAVNMIVIEINVHNTFGNFSTKIFTF